jgi:hypothetical protein
VVMQLPPSWGSMIRTLVSKTNGSARNGQPGEVLRRN